MVLVQRMFVTNEFYLKPWIKHPLTLIESGLYFNAVAFK